MRVYFWLILVVHLLASGCSVREPDMMRLSALRGDEYVAAREGAIARCRHLEMREKIVRQSLLFRAGHKELNAYLVEAETADEGIFVGRLLASEIWIMMIKERVETPSDRANLIAEAVLFDLFPFRAAKEVEFGRINHSGRRMMFVEALVKALIEDKTTPERDRGELLFEVLAKLNTTESFKTATERLIRDGGQGILTEMLFLADKNTIFNVLDEIVSIQKMSPSDDEAAKARTQKARLERIETNMGFVHELVRATSTREFGASLLLRIIGTVSGHSQELTDFGVLYQRDFAGEFYSECRTAAEAMGDELVTRRVGMLCDTLDMARRKADVRNVYKREESGIEVEELEPLE